MKDIDIEAEFEAILQKRQERDDKLKAAMDAKKEKERQQRQAYVDLRDALIVPALEEVISMMRRNDTDGGIKIDDYGSVEFVVTKGLRTPVDRLRLSSGREGTISVSGPGTGSKEVPFSEVNQATVQRMAMDFLRVVILGPT